MTLKFGMQSLVRESEALIARKAPNAPSPQVPSPNTPVGRNVASKLLNPKKRYQYHHLIVLVPQ